MNETFNKAVDQLISYTDFPKIQKTMKALDWTWRGEDKVPSIKRMIAEVRRLALNMEESNSTSISCGGFRLVKLDYNGVPHLSLMFCITSIDKQL